MRAAMRNPHATRGGRRGRLLDINSSQKSWEIDENHQKRGSSRGDVGSNVEQGSLLSGKQGISFHSFPLGMVSRGLRLALHKPHVLRKQ